MCMQVSMYTALMGLEKKSNRFKKGGRKKKKITAKEEGLSRTKERRIHPNKIGTLSLGYPLLPLSRRIYDAVRDKRTADPLMSLFFFLFFFLAAFRGDEKLNPPMAELKVPCEIRYYASACRPSSQCAIGFQRHKEYLLIGSNLIRVEAESTESIPSARLRSRALLPTFFSPIFPNLRSWTDHPFAFVFLKVLILNDNLNNVILCFFFFLRILTNSSII